MNNLHNIRYTLDLAETGCSDWEIKYSSDISQLLGMFEAARSVISELRNELMLSDRYVDKLPATTTAVKDASEMLDRF